MHCSKHMIWLTHLILAPTSDLERGQIIEVSRGAAEPGPEPRLTGAGTTSLHDEASGCSWHLSIQSWERA